MAKRRSLVDNVDDITPVIGENGLVVTSIREGDPEPIDPPQPQQQEPEASSETPIDNVETNVAQAFSEQEYQPNIDELSQQATDLRAQVAPVGSFGEFTPATMVELNELKDPGISTALREGFSDGLLGWMLGTRRGDMSLSELDKRTAEIDNYRERNPFSSFVAESVGGLVSDLPIELAVALGTGMLGNGILLAARTAPVGRRAFRQMAGSVINIRKAYRANSKGSRLSSSITRFSTQFVEGAIAGSISESIQQAGGKRGDINDVIERAVMDGVASGPMHQMFRWGGRLSKKSFATYRKSAAKRIAKTVEADNPELKGKVEKSIKDLVDEQPHRGVDPDKPRVTLDESGKTSLTRGQIDVDEARLSELSAKNPLKSKGSLKTWLKGIMDGVSNKHHEFADVINARRKAVFGKGSRFSKLFERNKYDIGTLEGVNRVLDDTHRIMQARMDNTTRAGVLTDISDIILNDLDPKSANALRAMVGAGDDATLSPEQAGALSQALDKFVATGVSTRAKGVGAKKVKDGLSSVRNWLETVYADNPRASTRVDNQVSNAKAEKPRVIIPDARVELDTRAELDAGPTAIEEASRIQAREEVKGLVESAKADIPDSKGAGNKLWQSIANVKLIGFGNFTLDSIFDGMGETFSTFRSKFQAAREVENGVIFQLSNTLRSSMGKLGVTSDMVTGMSEVVEIQVGTKVFNTSKSDALNLHMNAVAKSEVGMKGEDPAFGEKPNFSNSEALLKKGYKFDGADRRTKFTEDEVELLASEEWVVENIGQEALNIRDGIRTTLAEARDMMNAYSNEKLGVDVLDATNVDYWMKNSEFDLGLSEGQVQDSITKAINTRSLADDSRKTLVDIFGLTTLNRTRRGNSTLVAQNPLEATAKYINDVSRMLAFGDDLAQLTLVTGGASRTISNHLGDQYIEGITKYIARTSNASPNKLDLGADKFQGKLFRNFVFSALSFNPTTPFKQIPSYLTALGQMGIDKAQGAKAFMDTFKFGVGNPLERPSTRDPKHAELMATDPTYANRFTRAGQSADISDTQSTSLAQKLLYGEVKLSDSFKQRGGILGVKDAFFNVVEKGMIGIQEADAMTLRAIYRGVEIELGVDASQADISNRFATLVDETQPTAHPTTRSLNQMSDNLLLRMFVMFSSQPVKNFNLFLRNFTTAQNTKSPEDWALAKKTFVTLAMQSAAISTIGIGMGEGKELAFSSIRSEDAQRNRDRFFQDKSKVAGHISKFLRDAAGNAPLAGPLLGNLLSGAIGGPAFKQEVPLLSVYNDLADAMSSDEVLTLNNANKILKRVGEATGVPSNVLKIIKEASSNLK